MQIRNWYTPQAGNSAYKLRCTIITSYILYTYHTPHPYPASLYTQLIGSWREVLLNTKSCPEALLRPCVFLIELQCGWRLKKQRVEGPCFFFAHPGGFGRLNVFLLRSTCFFRWDVWSGWKELLMLLVPLKTSKKLVGSGLDRFHGPSSRVF